MLLDSGTSPLTRKAAAEQIGAVQKLHPHELHNLLKKVTNHHFNEVVNSLNFVVNVVVMILYMFCSYRIAGYFRG